MRFRLSLALLLGLLGAFKLNIVGSITYSELILLAILPALPIIVLRLMKEKGLVVVLILGLAYLASLMASDLYRASPPSDFLRGWSKIGITLVSIVIFYSLISDGRSIGISYIVGVLVSGTIGFYQFRDQGDFGYLYKFYLGNVVSCLAFFVVSCSPPSTKGLMKWAPLLAGALCFIFNARSLAGVTIMAYFANMWADSTSARALRQGGRLQVSKTRVLMGLLALSAGAVGIFSFYRISAARGWLGSAAEEKYEEQRQLNTDGSFTLISGRTEILYSWPKIVESPLIGYGSWAKDWSYVYERSEAVGLNPEAMTESYAPNEPGLIPAHSHIFGGWLEAGLVGGIFWLVIFWRTLLVLVRGDIVVWGRYAPVMAYVLVGFLWELVFSPYGAEGRMWDGFIIAAVVWIEASLRRNQKWPLFGQGPPHADPIGSR